MAQEKKYDYRLVQDSDTWTTEITKRVTARKTTVTKRKKDFETQAQAKEWGETKLAEYVESLQQHNKRKAEKRAVRNELEAKAEAEQAAREEKYLAAKAAAELADDEDE